jgi:hypothetical protein
MPGPAQVSTWRSRVVVVAGVRWRLDSKGRFGLLRTLVATRLPTVLPGVSMSPLGPHLFLPGSASWQAVAPICPAAHRPH